MIEAVVGLLMFINGEIKEARIQESMATCLKHKRQAEREFNESVSYISPLININNPTPVSYTHLTLPTKRIV